MNLTRLSVLKDKLMAAVDFKEPWDYFFENFGEDPEFFKFGKRAKLPILKEVVTKVGQRLFKQEKILVSDFLLTQIARHHFFHGACFIEGKIATILFFDDIDMGLIAIFLKGSEISLARFSTVQLEKEKEVFLAPLSANRMTRH